MKEKNKKILKTLGVGALACAGLFTFTGCSLNDEEKADVMQGLENANTYMEQTIDLLKDQNKNLKDHNDQLEDYIAELQQSNAKITTEEAWNKLMIAKSKLETNYQGIRNNLTATYVATDGQFTQTQIVDLYKTENNGYVSYVWYNEDSNIDSSMHYENDGKVYEYTQYMSAGGNIEYTKEVRTDLASSESCSGLTYAMTPLFLDELSTDNIYSVEILENGNYKISAVIEKEYENESLTLHDKQTHLLEYELTSDCKIISTNINQYVKRETSENSIDKFEVLTTSVIIKMEYNTITEGYINNLLQEAINKELKEEY